jgi:hypothetical protein
LRHRCKVMTLTPSVRAISLCNFPCVANLFACASFVAISTLECLFVSAIAACLVATAACHRPFASYANFIAGNVLFFYRGQRVVFYCGQRLFLLRATCCFYWGNVLFPCRFRKAEQIVPERIARQKSPDAMATIAALQINMMGRSVRCKRLLRCVMRVPFAW